MKTRLLVGFAVAALSAIAPAFAASVGTKDFGHLADGRPAHLYTLTNAHGFRVDVTDYGATVVNLFAPDKAGHLANIVLGHDDVMGYVNGPGYFGATIGRYGNRIAHGQFKLDGKTYTLPLNDHPNGKDCTLHGGPEGFDKRMWTATPGEDHGDPQVRFTYHSADGEMGFPGNVEAQVTFTVTPDNELRIEYQATTDKPTPINLTNHSYFNLHGAGHGTILDHQLRILASNMTPVDAGLIPTGDITLVANTPFDFTTPHAIGERIGDDNHQLKIAGGYDHNWVLDAADGKLALAATVYEPQSGRTIEVRTTEPGVQFYSSNFLHGEPGRAGEVYAHNGALCLETQHFPDSPNHPNFPSTIVHPGETYHSTTVYRFGTK